MKKYIDAELQIVRMNNNDIVTTSSRAILGSDEYKFYNDGVDGEDVL